MYDYLHAYLYKVINELDEHCKKYIADMRWYEIIVDSDEDDVWMVWNFDFQNFILIWIFLMKLYDVSHLCLSKNHIIFLIITCYLLFVLYEYHSTLIFVWDYSIQLNLYAIPTSVQALNLGYSLPPNANWTFPVTSTTPQFNIFSKTYGNLIGLNYWIYPVTTQETTQSFIQQQNLSTVL